MAEPKKKKFHEQIADQLIKQLEAGTAPWLKPWKPGEDMMPRNAISNKRYRGANSLFLSMQGRSDPRWLTYKQAQSIGAQVKKGEKGTLVQYWQFHEEVPKKDEHGRPVIGADGKPEKTKRELERPRVFNAVVFNGEQIDRMPPLPERKKEPEWQAHDRAENILKSSGANIRHVPGDRAYYNSSSDQITLPERSQFDAPDKYYATALHELGHWTGHESRLGRDLANPFGSEAYAKEELRAEIASMMVGNEVGVGHDPGQHAAYVGSWIKALKEDPLEIVRAASDAEKIMSLVMSYEQTQEQTQTHEKEQSQEQSNARINDEESRAARISQDTATDRERLVAAEKEYQRTQENLKRFDTFTSTVNGKPELCLVELDQNRDPTKIVPFSERDQPQNKSLFDKYDAAKVEANLATETLEDAQENFRVGVLKASDKLESMEMRAGPSMTLDTAEEQIQEMMQAAAQTSPERTYLDVPFREKDEAKALGAKWDKQEKSWFVPAGMDTAAFEKWMPDVAQNTNEPELEPDTYELEPDELEAARVADFEEAHLDAVMERGAAEKTVRDAYERDYDFKEQVNEKASALCEDAFKTYDAAEKHYLGIGDDNSAAKEKAGNALDVALEDYGSQMKAAVEKVLAEHVETVISQGKSAIEQSQTSPDAAREAEAENSQEAIARVQEQERAGMFEQGQAEAPTIEQAAANIKNEQTEKDQIKEIGKKVFLAVPFKEKDEAKALGARWDKQENSWYAPPGVELSKLEKWMPGNKLVADNPAISARDEFKDALKEMGCLPDDDKQTRHPVMDGKHHRIPVVGDKAGERSGFYFAHTDGRPAGFIMNNKTGQKSKWVAKGQKFSKEQLAALTAQAAQKKQERAAEREQTHENTAAKIKSQFSRLSPVTTPTPYMQAKGIGQETAVGLKVGRQNETVIPAFDVSGKHWTSQYIQEDGTKRFAKDSRKEGCFHVVGGDHGTLDKAPNIIICEGYATGASIKKAFPDAGVVAAFDSGNLSHVAKDIAEKWPDKPKVIAGDDDIHAVMTHGTNVGREKAEKAAKEIGAVAVFPTFKASEKSWPADVPKITPQQWRAGDVTEAQKKAMSEYKKLTDFNDLSQKSSLGQDAVKRQVGGAINRAATKQTRSTPIQTQDNIKTQAQEEKRVQKRSMPNPDGRAIKRGRSR